ncbi:MAG: oxidoreductase [Gemmatimonadaceae bacterium]|jgi:predicted dehydrogenase|nr:oxidoreductase [Gemmatimonadaceae bacterium]
MTPSAPISVALVGFGMAGRTFHAPLITATPGFVLRTVVSQQGDAVRAALPAVRVTPSLRDALDDAATELVVVATPTALHTEHALAALEAGKHVVVDKPFATSVADATRVLDAARRAKRLAVAFQNRRFDSDYLTLRALVHGGAVGDVVHMDSHFDRYRPLVRDRWRERAGPGSGVWLDLGAHLVDQAVHLFGAPLAINADLMQQRAGATSDDAFLATLRYASHRVIVRASSLAADHTLRFVVHGTLGSFEKHGLDVQERALAAGAHPGGADWGVDPEHGTLTVPQGDDMRSREVRPIPGDYRRFYEQLRDAIRADALPPVTPTEILTVMRVLDAGVESSAARREVALA